MPSPLRKRRQKLRRTPHRPPPRGRSSSRSRNTRRHSTYHDATPPPPGPPKPPPDPKPGGNPPPPPDANHRNAERLLWRAGFGPRPGDVDRVVSLGIPAAVHALVYPTGAANLVGPEPTDEDGNALAPEDAWGHDHLWWLDRMVRSDQQLVGRMTLIWHDWFRPTNDKAGGHRLMLDQNNPARR